MCYLQVAKKKNHKIHLYYKSIVFSWKDRLILATAVSCNSMYMDVEEEIIEIDSSMMIIAIAYILVDCPVNLEHVSILIGIQI